MAKKTLQVTTQLNWNGENTSLARNLGTNDCMLRYRRIMSHFFTDTFLSQGKQILLGVIHARKYLSLIRDL